MTEKPAGPPGGQGHITRRQALIGGGAVAAGGGAVAGVILGTSANGAAYPRVPVAQLSSIRPNTPLTFGYPLAEQPNILLDFGHAVPEGVGPNQSIVAYSILCQHMGCPVTYLPLSRELVCPCHQTRYDPERLGSMIQGVAMLPLPRVQLEVKDGVVHAVGIDGLIYGYRDNLHPGKPAGGAK